MLFDWAVIVLINNKEGIEQVEQHIRKSLIIVSIALFILFTDIFGRFTDEDVTFVAVFFALGRMNSNNKENVCWSFKVALFEVELFEIGLDES